MALHRLNIFATLRQAQSAALPARLVSPNLNIISEHVKIIWSVVISKNLFPHLSDDLNLFLTFWFLFGLANSFMTRSKVKEKSLTPLKLLEFIFPPSHTHTNTKNTEDPPRPSLS